MIINYLDCSDNLLLNYAYTKISLLNGNSEYIITYSFRPISSSLSNNRLLVDSWDTQIYIEPDFLIDNRLLNLQDWSQYPDLNEALSNLINDETKENLYNAIRLKVIQKADVLTINTVKKPKPLSLSQYINWVFPKLPNNTPQSTIDSIRNSIIRSYDSYVAYFNNSNR